MNDRHDQDPMSQFQYDASLINICLDVNAYTRSYRARRRATFDVPVVGTHVFIVACLPDGVYADTGIYRIVAMSRKDPFNSQYKLAATLVNPDDLTFENEKLKEEYLALTHGLCLATSLTGTFTTEGGYDWENNYIDLRQYVIRHLLKLKGMSRLKRDIECVKIRYPFTRQSLDKRLDYDYSGTAWLTPLLVADGIGGLALTVALFLSTGFTVTMVLFVLFSAYAAGHLSFVKADIQRQSLYADTLLRLYGRYNKMFQDGNNSKQDLHYKAQILAEIAKGLPGDRTVIGWHIFKFNVAVEALPDDTLLSLRRLAVFDDFVCAISRINER